MAVDNYRQAFKSAIARIYHTSGAVVGAGFLVNDRQLLTCAHVVTAALGIPVNTSEASTDAIDVDFPLIAPDLKIKAKHWGRYSGIGVGEPAVTQSVCSVGSGG
jgi:hypothetical protein